MPSQYEAIRDKFIAEGMDEAEAKERAAKIYNSKHPEDPVTRNSDKTATPQKNTNETPKLR